MLDDRSGFWPFAILLWRTLCPQLVSPMLPSVVLVFAPEEVVRQRQTQHRTLHDVAFASIQFDNDK
jgi:hypothetical protein